MFRKPKPYTVNNSYLAHLTIEEGLAIINDEPRLKKALMINNERVGRDYQRFAILRSQQHSLQCYNCGVKATHWLVERHRNEQMPYHLNVYAGKRMLTWDHILPRSLGGSNLPMNGRIACSICNERRGNAMTMHELLWAIRQDPKKVFRDLQYSPNQKLTPLSELFREAKVLRTV